MAQYVNRVVNISYDAERVRFETDEQMNQFYQALGRMVAFAMASDNPRDIEYVNLSVDYNREITGCYYPTWKRGETYRENAVQYVLDDAVVPFKQGTPFVMGAIPRDGGSSYSFHS